MLKVTVEICPFGDEAKAYILGVIILGNTLVVEDGKHKYHIAAYSQNGRKIEHQHILHKRSDGWLKLVLKALRSVKTLMSQFDKPM